MSKPYTEEARDAIDALGMTREAEARQFEHFKQKLGTAGAEKIFENRELERQGRIKRNEREIERMEAENKYGEGMPHIQTLKNGKKLLVFNE
jgi:hypothetical protein